MKVQIKTLNQKSMQVEIEETKTVFDLKKELSLYPDVGVRPELQKLIYAGKVLDNDDALSACNIASSKFLVVMILKQPEQPPARQQDPLENTAVEPVSPDRDEVAISDCVGASADATTPSTPTAPSTPSMRPVGAPNSEREEMVTQIVSMGYPESEVRRALQASFFNPERAIEYLIEGIPASVENVPDAVFSEMGSDISEPLDIIRNDPNFRSLRRAIMEHPELLESVIHRIGEMSPSVLNLLHENPYDVLNMLIDESDSEDDQDGRIDSSGV